MHINIKTRKDDNSISIISMFLVFILIFYNNETFPSIFFNGPGQTIYYLFVIVGIGFLFTILFRKQKLNTEATLLVIFLMTLLFITMLLNQDYSGGFIKIIIEILIGYMLIHLVTAPQFFASCSLSTSRKTPKGRSTSSISLTVGDVLNIGEIRIMARP